MFGLRRKQTLAQTYLWYRIALELQKHEGIMEEREIIAKFERQHDRATVDYYLKLMVQAGLLISEVQEWADEHGTYRAPTFILPTKRLARFAA